MKTFLSKATLLSALISLLASSLIVFANEPDSLAIKLSQAKNPNEFFVVHIEIAKNLKSSNSDSAFFHVEKALEWAYKTENFEKIYTALNLQGTLCNETGQYNKALETFQSILELAQLNSFPAKIAQTHSNIANCYALKSNTVKAIESYQKAIEYFDRTVDPYEKAVLYGRLGNLYYLSWNNNEAIRYYKKAREIFAQNGWEAGVATTLMNIGNCFKRIDILDSALVYYTDGLNKFRSIGNRPHNEAQCLANIGNTHHVKGNNTEAERFLLSADSLFSKIENPYSMSLVNRDLAYVYLETNRLNLAKQRIDNSLNLAQENGYDDLVMGAYKQLYLYFEKLNDYKNTYIWIKEYMTFKNLYEEKEKEANIDRLLAEFEAERKEREIELLKKSDEINQLKIRRRTLNLYISLLAFFIAISFIVFLYDSNRKKKRTNQLLSEHNVEINQQKEEIIAQRDEIESQRDLLQNQNKLLEQFRTHTTESLRYAQSIQAAILPSEKVLQQISAESFVLMKPCELVSGDFFWATSFDDYHIFCVADCTGHGVPGAFMSILGITALNDIVARHRVTKPAEILGYLRESVINALNQNDPEQQHKDGMDIALCSLNKKTKELQFAGAGIPLLIATNHALQKDIECNSIVTNEHNLSLYEVKGNIMPVGSSPRMKPFTNITIPLQNNSVYLYLVTDGFQDQMGGESNKKFGVKNLRNLLLSNANLSSKIQHNGLNTTFEEWRKGFEQIDDVTILGIKI